MKNLLMFLVLIAACSACESKSAKRAKAMKASGELTMFEKANAYDERMAHIETLMFTADYVSANGMYDVQLRQLIITDPITNEYVAVTFSQVDSLNYTQFHYNNNDE